MRNNIELAVKNIYSYSDTDIFPHPVENLIFRDKTKEVCDLVQAYHDDFENSLSKTPPVNISCCAPLGYSGFRWVTQIDPLWNAYFLALTIDKATKITAITTKLNLFNSFRMFFHFVKEFFLIVTTH